MIISHEHKFIFIKTKKVAGTSVEIALSELCGPQDVITPIYEEELRNQRSARGAQNYHLSAKHMSLRQKISQTVKRKRPVRFRNHMSAAQILKEVGPEIWEEYTTISIVRNPFDVIVSRYFWDTRLSPQKISFRNFLLERPELLLENRRIAWIEGPAAVDVMLRYEHLADDLSALSHRVNLPSDLGAEIAKVSVKRGVRPIDARTEEVFKDFSDGIDLVSILCRPEIRAFGYSVPNSIGPTTPA